MEFALLDQDGKELDRDRIDVGITQDGRFLHLPAIDFGSGKSSGHPFDVFYVYPESHTERMNVVASALRDRDNRSGRTECFGWSWGDLAGFIPPEDPYMRPWDNLWLSVKTYKERIRLMKASRDARAILHFGFVGGRGGVRALPSASRLVHVRPQRRGRRLRHGSACPVRASPRIRIRPAGERRRSRTNGPDAAGDAALGGGPNHPPWQGDGIPGRPLGRMDDERGARETTARTAARLPRPWSRRTGCRPNRSRPSRTW